MPLYDRPNLLIFDWDGTLVDTFSLLHDAHNHVRRVTGWPLLSRAELQDHIRASARESFPEIFGKQYETALAEYYSFIEKNHLDKLTQQPYAQELLHDLYQTTNIVLAIISNKRQNYLEDELASLNWMHYFSGVVGAGEAKRDKPSAEPIYKLLEELHSIGHYSCEKSRIWFIGDTITDMACAEAAGITPVYIRNGYGVEAEILQNSCPAHVINDCKSLLDMLKN